MAREDIDHLVFLASKEEYHGLVLDELLKPSFSLFGEMTKSGFSSSADNLTERLSTPCDRSRFIAIRILTEYLLFPQKRPPWAREWILSRTMLKTMFPASVWDNMEKSDWTAVPLLLISDDQVYTRYIVMTLLPTKRRSQPYPSWAEELMDDTFREAILTAMTVACAGFPEEKRAAFFCYPLVIPNKHRQLEGRSCALPLALGIRSLLSDKPIPRNLAATGDLDEKGRVLRVCNIDKKAQCSKAEFSALLYPSENAPWTQTHGIERLPVSDFKQACMFCDLYSPGNAGKLLIFAEMLENPAMFVSNCNELPHPWLSWLVSHGRIDPISKAVSKSPDLLLALGNRLKAAADNFHLERSKAISSIITPDHLRQSCKKAPFAAFSWYTSNLALANHQGKLTDAEYWKDQAAPLAPEAVKRDIESVALFYNHFLVSRHNRYDFRPDLPKEIDSIMAFLEEQYRNRCIFGCPTYPILGQLYGSILQNYAFCGKEHLSKVEGIFEKARKAFGEKSANELKPEWLRQYHYMTYAYLDAGDFEKAGRTFFHYLEMQSWKKIRPRLHDFSCWQHALMARLMADTDHQDEGGMYLRWVRKNSHLFKEKSGHPWQLWFRNMARIALKEDDEAAALDFFKESLEQCSSDKVGPTVHVMALLPLSGIHRLKQLKKLDMSKAEASIRNAAKQLDKNHFEWVQKTDFRKLLKAVWTEPEKLFPFTYR